MTNTPLASMLRRGALIVAFSSVLCGIAFLRDFNYSLYDACDHGVYLTSRTENSIINSTENAIINPTENAIATPTAIQVRPCRIWIDVQSYDEGMSKWRHSIPQLMALANILNATLVEPCMTKGRLKACKTKFKKAPLSQIFNMTHYYINNKTDQVPLLASYGVFQQSLTHRSVHVKVDDQKKDKASLMQKILDLIDSYVLSNDQDVDHVVINLSSYRMDKNKSWEPLPSLVDFHAQHELRLDQVMSRANLTDGNYGVIHWRAEIAPLDYMECAQEIVQLRKLMKNTTMMNSTTKFILMSSLNSDPENMWKGSRNKANKDKESFRALEMLVRDQNFLKLDTLLTPQEKRDLVDPGVLAIYDLILAARAASFATCARNHCEHKRCSKCNYVGGFASYTVEYRKSRGRPNDFICWDNT